MSLSRCVSCEDLTSRNQEQILTELRSLRDHTTTELTKYYKSIHGNRFESEEALKTEVSNVVLNLRKLKQEIHQLESLEPADVTYLKNSMKCLESSLYKLQTETRKELSRLGQEQVDLESALLDMNRQIKTWSKLNK